MTSKKQKRSAELQAMRNTLAGLDGDTFTQLRRGYYQISDGLGNMLEAVETAVAALPAGQDGEAAEQLLTLLGALSGLQTEFDLRTRNVDV